MSASNCRLVLGLGNLLHRDEGLGIHALQALAECLRSRTPGVEFVDGGTLGLELLPLVEACSHLLVLDAVDAGYPPGSLIELPGEAIPLAAGMKLSQHQLTFQEIAGLARFRGNLPPQFHLVGLQPADLSLGVGLSPVVAAALPRLLEGAARVLGAWRLLIPVPEKL